MDRIFSILTGEGGKLLNYGYDDDFNDRLSHVYSVIILLICAFTVSMRQWVGSPITCMNSIHQQSYVEDLCWVNSTYWLGDVQGKPVNVVPIRRHNLKVLHLTYYQWVPFILLVQALLFAIPCFIWRNLRQKSGIDVKAIADSICERDTKCLDPDEKKKVVGYVVKNISYSLQVQKKSSNYRALALLRSVAQKTCGVLYGRRAGNFLFSLYMMIKILYMLNLLMQFVILNNFLSLEKSHALYGFALLSDLIRHGKDSWSKTGVFPRLAFCDFETYDTANKQTYTVLCALPINLFNEKIYLVIWFWLFILFPLSLLNFVKWLCRFLPRSSRFRYLKKHLKLAADELFPGAKRPSDDRINDFCYKYLRVDGIFLVHIIGDNTNGRVATNVVKGLWLNYKEKCGAHSPDSSTPTSVEIDDVTLPKRRLE